MLARTAAQSEGTMDEKRALIFKNAEETAATLARKQAAYEHARGEVEKARHYRIERGPAKTVKHRVLDPWCGETGRLLDDETAREFDSAGYTPEFHGAREKATQAELDLEKAFASYTEAARARDFALAQVLSEKMTAAANAQKDAADRQASAAEKQANSAEKQANTAERQAASAEAQAKSAESQTEIARRMKQLTFVLALITLLQLLTSCWNAVVQGKSATAPDRGHVDGGL